MNRKVPDRIVRPNWIVKTFFLLGVLLIFAGSFLRREAVPGDLLHFFVDAGAGIILAAITAYFLE